MPTETPKTLRIVAFREGDTWVAQCLEHDIQVQGTDFDSVRRRMTAAIACEARYTAENCGGPFNGIAPAPQFFHKKFDAVEATMSSDDFEMRIAA